MKNWTAKRYLLFSNDLSPQLIMDNALRKGLYPFVDEFLQKYEVTEWYCSRKYGSPNVKQIEAFIPSVRFYFCDSDNNADMIFMELFQYLRANNIICYNLIPEIPPPENLYNNLPYIQQACEIARDIMYRYESAYRYCQKECYDEISSNGKELRDSMSDSTEKQKDEAIHFIHNNLGVSEPNYGHIPEWEQVKSGFQAVTSTLGDIVDIETTRNPIKSKTTRIGILLGSGVSTAAGLPSTGEVTERILSGQDISRHSAAVYELTTHTNGFADEYVPKVLKFLQILKCEVDDYYTNENGVLTNYEDLYFIASQIHDSEWGEYDNPAIQPLIDKISPDIVPLLEGDEISAPMKNVIDIARETIHYISDVVWHLLDRKPMRNDHLVWITDASQEDSPVGIDIFTTNHDTVLEQCLRENNIQFVDGFGNAVEEVRYWEPKSFEARSTAKVKIIKLHGSVDWFRLRSQQDGREIESIGIPLNYDYEHTKDPNGNPQRTVESRPIILVGTLNKMLQYTNWIYAELFYQFRQILKSCDTLVISGYSFGDKGINASVIEWINAEPDHKLIIIHPYPDRLKNQARAAIQKSWDEWLAQNKMQIISKLNEQVSWEEIRKIL